MSVAAGHLDLTPWLALKKGLVSNLPPQRIGEVLGRRMALAYLPQLFKKGGDPAWPKPKYRSGFALRDRDRLMSSFVYKSTATGAEIWTPVIYAGPHHRGDEVKAKNASGLLWIPNRKLIGPSTPAMTISQIIKQFSLFRPYKKGEKKGGKKQARFVNAKFETYIFGTPSVKLPPRPFMEWSPAAITDALKTLDALVKAGIKGTA